MTTDGIRPIKAVPRVLLVAHRLGGRAATGTQRYARELSDAIAASRRGAEYVVTEVAGRRAMQLGWYVARRPRAERMLPTAELVHVLTPFAPVPARVPVVYTVHDLFPLTHPQWYPRPFRVKFGRAMRDVVRHAAHVIAVSDYTAAEIDRVLAIDRARVTVIPEAAADSFAVALGDDERAAVCARYGVTAGRFFVVVGAMAPRKNVEPVIRAMATQPDLTGYHLVLTGPELPGSEPIRAAARSLGDRCRITGLVPDTDLAALVSSATALVHPATLEGFGLTPLEAMAAGTAVVVSRAGSLPEVVGDAGILVEPADDQAWGDALARLAGDGAARADLVERGRRRAAAFSWRQAADATVAVHDLVRGLDVRTSA